MEGPTVVKIDNMYYLFYSANHFMSKDYAVGYATAPTPFGPWTKNPANPIISREILGESGSGHGDIFTDKDGKLRYVFLTHNSEDEVSPRRTRIVSLKMITEDDPSLPPRIVADPSSILKPVVAGAGKVYSNPVINVGAPDPTVMRHTDGTYIYMLRRISTMSLYSNRVIL